MPGPLAGYFRKVYKKVYFLEWGNMGKMAPKIVILYRR